MMPLLLRQRAHPIRESQRRFEIRKLIGSRQMVLSNNTPLGALGQLIQNF